MYWLITHLQDSLLKIDTFPWLKPKEMLCKLSHWYNLSVLDCKHSSPRSETKSATDTIDIEFFAIQTSMFTRYLLAMWSPSFWQTYFTKLENVLPILSKSSAPSLPVQLFRDVKNGCTHLSTSNFITLFDSKKLIKMRNTLDIIVHTFGIKLRQRSSH